MQKRIKEILKETFLILFTSAEKYAILKALLVSTL